MAVGPNVVAGSQYCVDGRLEVAPGYDAGAADVARRAGMKYLPDRVWCPDVCLCDGEYKLLEISTFSCGGLYAADLRKVVAAVAEEALHEWAEYRA